jgi:hypothetical protein
MTKTQDQPSRHNRPRFADKFPPKADIRGRCLDVRFVLSVQSVDATQALNLVRLGFRSSKSRATVHCVCRATRLNWKCAPPAVPQRLLGHRVELSNISSTHRPSTPSLTSDIKCCVDPLRPPPKADIAHQRTARSCGLKQVPSVWSATAPKVTPWVPVTVITWSARDGCPSVDNVAPLHCRGAVRPRKGGGAQVHAQDTKRPAATE